MKTKIKRKKTSTNEKLTSLHIYFYVIAKQKIKC